MLIFTNHSGKIPRPALQRCQAGRGFFITLFILSRDSTSLNPTLFPSGKTKVSDEQQATRQRPN